MGRDNTADPGPARVARAAPQHLGDQRDQFLHGRPSEMCSTSCHCSCPMCWDQDEHHRPDRGHRRRTASLLKVFRDGCRQAAPAQMAGGGRLRHLGGGQAVLLPGHFLQGIAAVRWADRFGKGIRTAPRDALIADSVPEQQRGLAFGVQRAADTGGAMLGVLIALLVVWLSQRGR